MKSKKIADSETLQYTSVFRLCGVLAYWVGLLVTSGCGTPLVYPFYPRTGAHGIVVDQDNTPVPDIGMRADWCKASMFWVMMCPQKIYRFQTDKQGRWEFYTRDAEDMYIGAYRMIATGVAEPLGRIGPLKSGECPTNTVVFRLNIKVLNNPRK